MARKRSKRSFRSRLAPLAGTAVAAASVGVAATSGSHASAEIYTCNTATGPSSKFDGNFTNGGQDSDGTLASMTTRYGAVCDTDQSQAPTPSNFDFNWVMVQDPHNNTKYSQSGYIRWFNSAIYPAGEYNHGTGFTRMYWYANPLSLGTTHTYKTVRNTTSCVGGLSACFKNYLDNHLLSQSDFNPASYFAHPYVSEWFGEVKYNESDQAGFASASMPFAKQQRRDFSTGTWTSSIGSQQPRNDNIYRWAKSAVGAGGFYIWTQ